MGLFSSKTKVYVASSVWNLAGDADKQPKVMPSLVISAALTGSKLSMVDKLKDGLLNSSGMRSRGFFRWASQHYSLGMPTGSIGAAIPVDGNTIAPALRTILGLGSNQLLQMLSVRIDNAEPNYWAEVWVRNQRSNLSEDDWTADYSASTNRILVGLPDNQIHAIPAPENFLWGLNNASRQLLYVAYQILTKVGDFHRPSETRLFTYRMGSGNAAFDSLSPAPSAMAEFFPVLPLRIHNKSLRDMAPERIEAVSKAFRKLTGGKIDDLLDSIEEHESVDDMDHVMVVPAVSLNNKNQAAQAYMFRFLQGMKASEKVSGNPLAYYANMFGAVKGMLQNDRWLSAHQEGKGSLQNPAHGRTVFTESVVSWPGATRNELRVGMDQLEEFTFKIHWNAIEESVHSGNARRFDGTARPLLGKGQYWFTALPDQMPPSFAHGNGVIQRAVQYSTVSRTLFFHQFDKHRYRMLTVYGLQHQNFVYGDKAVTITAREALEDDEESGFLFPLHHPTLRQLSLAHTAQLASNSLYVVINSYKKVKQRWYQRGIFKVVFAIAAIALSIVTAGGSLAAAGGILGTNLAVGTMLGASVAMAAVVGAVVNAIAGIVLTTILTKASTALLGEKLGTIIGAIISLAAIQVGASMGAGGTGSFDWASLGRADNLLRLTDSVSGAYTNFLAADTAEIYSQMQELGEEHAEALREIQTLSQDILGMTNVEIDPMILTDATEYFAEPSDVFLERTLLTGSDLAQMTHALIEGFVDFSLELPGAR